MRTLVDYINEAAEKQWVAIEVTTKGHFGSKDSTSQRVVSYDTYQEMREKGRTKGYMEILHLETISPVCKSRESAMEFIHVPDKKMRTSKIDKGSADYIVWCIATGKMNPSGSTKWDWNFWEEWKDSEIYIDKWGEKFLMGSPGSLKVGDKVFCVDNDTQKKLPGAPKEIVAISKCNLDDFRDTYRNAFPNKCKQPKRAFGKVSDGLPWGRMGQFYSIKGVAEEQ